MRRKTQRVDGSTFGECFFFLSMEGAASTAAFLRLREASEFMRDGSLPKVMCGHQNVSTWNEALFVSTAATLDSDPSRMEWNNMKGIINTIDKTLNIVQ